MSGKKIACEACGASFIEDCTCVETDAFLKEIEDRCPGFIDGMQEALRPVLIQLGERIATLEAENAKLRASLATDDLRQFAPPLDFKGPPPPLIDLDRPLPPVTTKAENYTNKNTVIPAYGKEAA